METGNEQEADTVGEDITIVGSSGNECDGTDVPPEIDVQGEGQGLSNKEGQKEGEEDESSREASETPTLKEAETESEVDSTGVKFEIENEETKGDGEEELKDSQDLAKLKEEEEQQTDVKEEENKFKENTEDETRSTVVSPKILRPKLPDFKENGQIKTGHSRSKTDPGKGSDIKAIIDKTVEDIKVLNQVDFTKTYSRPKKFPKPFAQKSQSTHASPRASPTSCSPCVVDDSASSLNRNRSRSLKILTDILKSGRGGAGNIPKDGAEEGKSVSDSHLVPRKPSLVKEEDCERRSSSDGQIGISSDSSKKKVSTGSIARDSGTADSDKTNYSTPEVPSPNEETRDIKSPVRKKDFSKFRRAKSEVRKLAVSDDEGVGESDQEAPHTSGPKSYHTIDTNSKFFTLWKTGAPKRRSGFAGLVQSVYNKDDMSRGEQSYIGPRKLHRVELKPIPTSRKISSIRHVTHPPTSKITFREDGALDTNGFGTILKSPTTDRPPPLPGELDSQASELSLADSQLGESVTDDAASFQDALESMINEPYECETDRPMEKKNGKLKPKSRSDPSGEKSKENMDFPKVVTSAHSSPILSKSSEEELEEDEGSEDTVKSEEISSMKEYTKEKRELRASLSLDEGVLDKGSSENILSPDSVGDTGLGQEDGKSSVKFLSFYTEDISGSSSPRNESPTGTPERQPNHLEVPHPSSGSKKGIGRSASSASVLVRERKNSAEKKESRKHSLTPAEEGSDKLHSLPLSDCRGESTSLPALNKPLKDKRFHIVEELYRNEQEYVEALTVLKDKYMLPLKTSCSSVDENLVDNIFYMIPEILMHHTVYQNSLDKVWKNWDIKSTIGNVIVATFSKQTVIDCYISFVENYKTSGKVIENALQTKSSVQKFIEQCHRESGSKLTMKDLIVRPIQRIPRYELLLQRLIEHTPRDHPDFLLLKEAEKVMHDFAIKLGTVNETQHEEDQQESLKRLELLLITDLAVPERQYLRHDMVNIITKKDQCCIWMFSDLIIVSSVKRRSGPVTRKVSIILKSPTGQDFAENIKHKVWLRVGLHAVEIVKNQTLVSQQKSVDPEQLEDDINLLNDINDLTSKLSCPHSSLDEVVQEMLNSLGKQYSEVTLRNSTADSNKLDLLVTTQERIYPLEVSFNSAEKRSQWESTFYDAKQKLAMMSDKRAPEFLQALQITKTRAGMQFSCAAPIDGLNAKGHRDVWVCNSDGYVGHMCLLSLQPEPIVTLNTPVPGCNARILCICAVPAYSGTFRRYSKTLPTFTRKSSDKRNKRGGVSREGPQIQIEEVEDTGTEDEDMSNAEDGYQTDSESSGEESESLEDVVAEEGEVNANVEDSCIEMKPLNVSEITQSTPDSITCSGNWHQDPHKSTMWLGTEDGCIHIFQSTDNIKTTKNKLKIHHESPVYCIVYLDNKVFVSLANGDLIVYKRDAEGVWDSENPYTRSIGTAQSPITRMLAVAGKLWCGCQNVIKVINPLTLSTETSFTISPNSNRGVQSMVCSGQGVWLASQQSSKILLYHATSYEFLMEISIAQAVSQKLQSADDIIRQHKAACLRITALLICKDLLWIGTSAGVILTVPTPRITSTTNRGSISSPSVTGLVYGHTGHVRFLTCVEMNAPLSSNKSDSESDDKPSETLPPHDMHRRSSMAATTATLATRMLVISGGDGYEDFRSNASNESAGRDDSTNHLLLWQV